jgi:hypothetical protein
VVMQAQWPSPTESRRLPWARVTVQARRGYVTGYVVLRILLS